MKEVKPRAQVVHPRDFRIFIDAATLKAIRIPRTAEPSKNFRIFIDAATLKVDGDENFVPGTLRNFRIFIDAATLKDDPFALGRRVGADFRIFIDAATLKGALSAGASMDGLAFPHLYRCGHIEGSVNGESIDARYFNFRIFIDAATLKEQIEAR